MSAGVFLYPCSLFFLNLREGFARESNAVLILFSFFFSVSLCLCG